ncbi:MAG TPA: glycoside hydrolase family 26 protein [Candidatus Alistipes intestinipullorum]|nr:glycoside hydrolase family 26 protein [Candidatus Alistipes intestinipullorum]
MKKMIYTLAVVLMAVSCSSSSGSEEPTPPPTSDEGGFNANQFTLTTTLCTENPSPEAVKVYDFLRENFGKKVISGAMSNVSWNMDEVEWLHTTTGSYPALWCVDYIHLAWGEPDWTGYADLDMAQEWWDANGLMAASWHWNVPKKQGDTAPEDMGFYTADTDFDVSQATVPGTYENGIVEADLAKIAVHLKRLRDRNIPLLWRPLHEAAGKWFWWGAKGPQPFKDLWIYMFNYFQKEGLNNLIWVWTSQNNDLGWYPGDAYVDIVGYDSYPSTDFHASLVGTFNSLALMTGGRKLLTLSECGGIPMPSAMFESGDMWSWFMPWYGEYTSGNPDDQEEERVNSEKDFRKIFSDERVLTRDEMPDLHAD